MSLFRLEGDGADARLVIARETDIELESQLENWLENSPWALGQDELILWINRQTSASGDDGTIRPDLLGVDYEGNLVIAELKRGRTPREVIAQLLEYAAWADKLPEEKVEQIAENYFQTRAEFEGRNFHDVFNDTFDTDEVPPLNRRLRLFVVAERIPSRILAVCKFLRDSHGMDINCIVVAAFQTESADVLVTTEAKVGGENFVVSKTLRQNPSQILQPEEGSNCPVPTSDRWSGEKTVKEVVLEAAQELTGKNTSTEFTTPEIVTLIRREHPNFKRPTVSAQLSMGVSNKYYARVEHGKYRLYDPDRDEAQTKDAQTNGTEACAEPDADLA